MINNLKFLICSSICMLFVSCSTRLPKGTFGYDLKFLKNNQQVVVLKQNHNKSELIVLPGLQGRVITSTSNGLEGNSYGWINYDLFAAGKFEEHYNPFGGEDRFWIGPEGGQYGLFFKKGTDFTFENWYTPKELDTEPFDVVSQSDTEVTFKKKMHLVNYQGFDFDVDVNRTVSIFSKEQVEHNLNIQLSNDVNFVAYQSNNELVNTGSEAWSKENGLLSIWILGMFIPSEKTTVILPYKDSLALNTSYFGTIPPDRLSITDKQVMYKGNGTSRFKLGLPPQNALPYMGSYDADKNMLTIINYSIDKDTTYVNSVWRLQNKPYAGDVVNSYNDGPLENGDQLGPFYELETSSSAKELKKGGAVRHIHTTYHFEGDFEALNKISIQLLGKNLKDLPL